MYRLVYIYTCNSYTLNSPYLNMLGLYIDIIHSI